MQGVLVADDGDALLARLDFLGNLYLENCTLMEAGPPPVRAPPTPRRVTLELLRHCNMQAVEAGTPPPHLVSRLWWFLLTSFQLFIESPWARAVSMAHGSLRGTRMQPPKYTRCKEIAHASTSSGYSSG